jgi:hypothetical protein
VPIARPILQGGAREIFIIVGNDPVYENTTLILLALVKFSHRLNEKAPFKKLGRGFVLLR